jgi:hypothetical protein
MARRFAAACLALAALPALVRAEDAEPQAGRISGLVFGDYYYIAANHEPTYEKQSAFWIRRAYLTYDRDLGSAFSVRFRLELNSPSLQETSDRLRPFLKDAYLRWTRGTHAVFLGLSPSPTWELIEPFWGYRHIEKTPLDLHRFGDARDMGISFKGSFGDEKRFGYHAMAGTGTGSRSENDKGKKLMLSLYAKPIGRLTLEAYADWDSHDGDKNVATLQGFAGYDDPRLRAGLQFTRQTRQQGPGKDDLALRILSGFVVGKLSPKWALVARADRMFDPDPGGSGIPYLPFDPTAKSTLFVLAVDHLPIPSVHLSPNLELVAYDAVAGRAKPKTDVVARVTVFWSF